VFEFVVKSVPGGDVANGHPRDELRNDIEAGRPGVAPDVDRLALRCAQLLDRKRSERFWNSIEYRIRLSESWRAWTSQPTTYLQDLDPLAAERIRRHVVSTLGKAESAAIRRGWELPRESE
jgi:hypothetical protein